MISQHEPLSINLQESANSFLRLSLNRKFQVLLSAQSVTEIIRLTAQQIVPIPDVEAQVMGVCDWRGEVLWLADLACLLRCKPLYQLKNQQPDYSAIVINYDGIHLGLVVYQIHQMQTYETRHMLPPNAPLPAGELRLPHIEGYLLAPNQDLLPVLECNSLLQRFHISMDVKL